MGCGRESQNIFYFIKNKNYKHAWFLVNHFDKLTYEDTIMPIICKIRGHDAYLSEPNDNEWACKRCHRFLPNYNHLRESRKAKLKKLKKISK